jgi:nucleotide-binding universal stress UspA family protein
MTVLNEQNESTGMVPEHVIVATDFSAASERAVSIAGKLARQFNASLSLLHVFETVAHHRYQIPVAWMVDAVRRDIKRQLFGKVEELKAAGINAHATLVQGGIATVEILKYLECHKNALAVMGTHARSGMERFLLGSTAEEVLRQAPCPIVTVGPHVVASSDDRAFRKILYATDCSECSLSAVPLVRTLWDSQSVEVAVLHVSRDSGFQPRLENAVLEPVRRALTAHAAAGAEPHYVTLHGSDVSQAIVNEAERIGADLIVLGVRRGGLCSMRLPPRITLQVIGAAPCAVLTVTSDAGSSFSAPSA